jgi:hypothetical protein
MAGRDPEKLNKLLKQNQRRRRAPELVQKWATLGVAASVIADDRHWKVIDRLKGGFSWPLQFVENLRELVHDFVAIADAVTILGWDIESEPALLVSSAGLLRVMPQIEPIYPDGFILINDTESTVLLVDFDEYEGTHANQMALPG